MGSQLRLTLGRCPSASGAADEVAWAAVLATFEAAEAAMSRFRETSELTALNRLAATGRSIRPSRMLGAALVTADRAHRITGGRFDPRVLLDLERLGYRGAPVDRRAGPSTAAPCRVLSRNAGDEVTLDRPVDLGGIGKGLTLRWAAAALARLGRRDLLLEAGGDVVTRGRDRHGDPWFVGIEDPSDPSEDRAVIEIRDGAVATSSIRVHRWKAGGRVVHHLLDPRTGEPADGGLLAVTVAASDPGWAEVWSKVLFVGGRRTIAVEARARGLAAWWIADDGSLEMTPAARAMTAWVADEAR